MPDELPANPKDSWDSIKINTSTPELGKREQTSLLNDPNVAGPLNDPNVSTSKLSVGTPRQDGESAMDFQGRKIRENPIAYATDPNFMGGASVGTKALVDPAATAVVGINTASWLTSPMAAIEAWNLAPLTHQYKSKTTLGQYAESFGVSSEAAWNAMQFRNYFPGPNAKEGEEGVPDYSMRVTESLIPNAPPVIKHSMALAISTFSDPTFSMGLGFAKVIKSGINQTRMAMKEGAPTVRNMVTAGLLEMMAIQSFPEEDVLKLQQLAAAVDVGDEMAAKELNEILDSPKYRDIFIEMERAETRAFHEKMIDDFGYTQRTIMEDGTVITQEEFSKAYNQIEKDYVSNYTKQSKAKQEAIYRESGLKGEALRKKMGETFIEVPKATPELKHEFRKLATAQIAAGKLDKHNRYVKTVIELSNLKNEAYTRKLIEENNIFKIIKMKDRNITADNLEDAMETIVQDAQQIYKNYISKQVDFKDIQEKSKHVPLDAILDKKPGEAWNTETFFAARVLIESLTSQVFDKAKKFRATGNSFDRVATLKAYENWVKLLNNVSDAKRVWGQSGNAQQLWLGDIELNNFNAVAQISQQLEEVGADKIIDYLADSAMDASYNGLGENFLTWLGRKERLLEDSIYESFVNSALSAISTTVKNLASNTTMLFLQPAEQFLSIPFGNFDGFMGGINQIQGTLLGFRDAFWFMTDQIAQSKMNFQIMPETQRWGRVHIVPQRFADAAAWRMQNMGMYPIEYLDPSIPMHEVSAQSRRKSISALAWGLDPNTKKGKTLDIFGKAVRTPGTLLEFQDRIFKMAGYRAELQKGARLQAKEFANGDPKIFKQYYQAALTAPNKTLVKDSQRFADYVTFQKALDPAWRSIQTPAQSRYGRWFFPFFKTPVNLIKAGYERSPLAYGEALYRMAQDPKRGQEALARATLGSITLGIVANSFDETELVGGYDINSPYGKRMKEAGIPPYSMKVDGQWHSYEGIDFLRSTIGMVANAMQASSQLDLEDPKDVDIYSEIWATAMVPFAKMVADQRWLDNISRMVYYIEAARGEATPTTGATLQREATRIVSTAIPFSAFMNQFQKHFVDDEFKAAESIIEQTLKNVPFFSPDMPAYPNLWGDPMKAMTNVGPDIYHTLKSFIGLPVGHEDSSDPVIKALKQYPVRIPGLMREYEGVKLKREEKIQVGVLTGKGVPGLTKPLHQRLSEVIRSSEFSRMQPQAKGDYLTNVIQQSRQAAIGIMISDSQRDPSPTSLWNRIQEAQLEEQRQMGFQ